jgi:hypothetical protein
VQSATTDVLAQQYDDLDTQSGENICYMESRLRHDCSRWYSSTQHGTHDQYQMWAHVRR